VGGIQPIHKRSVDPLRHKQVSYQAPKACHNQEVSIAHFEL